MEIDMIQKIVSILYSLLILGNSLFVKKYIGTFLFPASIFSLFWFVYTFFPLILIQVPVESYSILYILICTIIFTCSSLFYDWKKAFYINQVKISPVERSTLYNNKYIKIVFFVLQLIVIIFLIINILLQGFSLNDIIFDLFSSANKYMSMRYAGTLAKNIFSQLSIIFNYVGVVLGGILIVYTKKIRISIFIIVMSFLPSIMMMIVEAAKGYIFLSSMLFYSGVLIGRLNIGNTSLTNSRTNKVILCAILFLFPALVVSFLSRGIYYENIDFIINKLIFYFTSYAFGHIFAFSDWFSYYIDGTALLHYGPEDSPCYGFYTFMSLFKFFGSNITVPPGVYNDYYFYGHVLKTNIFTIYRGLILDFGLYGTLIFWFCIGIISHLFFYALLTLKRPVIAVVYFSIIFSFFYMSYIISIFMWNSIFASGFLLFIILLFNKIFNKYSQKSFR